MPTVPSKPLSQKLRPEITRLPPRTGWRRLLRRILKSLARLLVLICTRSQVRGLEHYPRQGPALVVINHLGDADGALGLAYFPSETDTLAKAELHDFPLLGMLMEVYGVIWVHRGRPDRRALRAALDGLKEGRIIALAPEARESLTGSLEEGTGGAAYLALKSGAPLVPVTYTGTENKHVYGSLKRFRRPCVTMTIGPAFTLAVGEHQHDAGHHDAIEAGTQKIMLTLAHQLPPEYRGAYQDPD
jgi:1-acyl-sn-glycerol-3-phosphate acyltransferase